MIPYTIERRADTGVTNVTMGIWLFLASEVMLFGALFSVYAMLRVAAVQWPAGGDVLDLRFGLFHTVLLVGVTLCASRARPISTPSRQRWLLIGTTLAGVFLASKGFEYREEFRAGLRPSMSTFLATYFTLTGLHALHVAGGVAANLWVAAGIGRNSEALTAGRAHGLALYWAFVDLIWVILLVLFY